MHSLNGNAKILMYHRFSEKPSFRKISLQTFESQLRLIKKHFEIISLGEFVCSLKRGISPGSNTVVLTFDDGYQDFYYYAFPLLQKYSLPATLFVTTDFIDGKMWMWPDVLEYAFLHTHKRTIHLPLGNITYRFMLDSYISRINAWNTIADHCLKVSNLDKFVIIDTVTRICGVQIPQYPVSDYQALNWDQLRYMSHHDIEIGSHTVTHPILSKMEKAENLSYEINASKKRISDCLDVDVNSFAYPNGNLGDYNMLAKQAIKKAGYECAVVSYPAAPGPNTDSLFELGRSSVGEDIVCFKKKIYNVEKPYIRFFSPGLSTHDFRNTHNPLIETQPDRRTEKSSDRHFSLNMISSKNKKSAQRNV